MRAAARHAVGSVQRLGVPVLGWLAARWRAGGQLLVRPWFGVLLLCASVVAQQEGSDPIHPGARLWSRVSRAWLCTGPVALEDEATPSMGRPDPYALEIPARRVREILTRAEFVPGRVMFASGIPAERPLVVELLGGRRLEIHSAFLGSTVWVSAYQQGYWTLAADDVDAWSALCTEAPPLADWEGVERMVVHDIPWRAPYQLRDDDLAGLRSLSVDVAALRLILREQEPQRLDLQRVGSWPSSGRLGVLSMGDGSRRRVFVEDSGRSVVSIASKETWRIPAAAAASVRSLAVLPRLDWSRVERCEVAVAPGAVGGVFTPRTRPDLLVEGHLVVEGGRAWLHPDRPEIGWLLSALADAPFRPDEVADPSSYRLQVWHAQGGQATYVVSVDASRIGRVDRDGVWVLEADVASRLRRVLFGGG